LDLQPSKGTKFVASFDGGAITQGVGGLLLGSANDAVRLTARLRPASVARAVRILIEHEVVTLVWQRVFGIALGYEDVNDHGTHPPEESQLQIASPHATDTRIAKQTLYRGPCTLRHVKVSVRYPG
jgi:DDE family transposase